jgi:ArsR family transcriptional regulator, arsenate/arsenite/antimonite-responsive transcriptional repressor
MTSTIPGSRLAAEQVRLFADPLRLAIVELLAQEELCTCHLVEATGAKQPTVSHHLRILREAGVIEPEAVGAYTYYRLRPDTLRPLADALADLADRAEKRTRRKIPCD